MENISDMRLGLPTPPNSPMFSMSSRRTATLSTSSLLEGVFSPLGTMTHHVSSGSIGGTATPRWESFMGEAEFWGNNQSSTTNINTPNQTHNSTGGLNESADLEMLSPLVSYHHSFASPGLNLTKALVADKFASPATLEMYARLASTAKLTSPPTNTTTTTTATCSTHDSTTCGCTDVESPNSSEREEDDNGMADLEPLSRESSPSPKRRQTSATTKSLVPVDEFAFQYPSMFNIEMGEHGNASAAAATAAPIPPPVLEKGRRRRTASKVSNTHSSSSMVEMDPATSTPTTTSTTTTSARTSKKKRTTENETTTLKRAMPSGAAHCPPIPLDAEDQEIVRLAMMEDQDEYKMQAFPGLLASCRARIEAAKGDKSAIVDALLDGFTQGNKQGRAIPKACTALIRDAAEVVQQTRNKSKEDGTARKLKPSDVERDGDHFPCPQCDKIYTTLEGLRLHDRNHHQVDKQWSCRAEGCKEHAFVRAADLRMHVVRMHSPVRPFPCRVPGCSKQYAAHSELRRHILVHHEDIVEVLAGGNTQQQQQQQPLAEVKV